MKFNATYLTRSEEELHKLQKSLELLAKHTLRSDSKESLDVFCTTFEEGTILVAPVNGILPSLNHSSRPYEGKRHVRLSVRLNKDNYGLALGNRMYSLRYSPVTNIAQFLPGFKESDSSRSTSYGDGSDLLDLDEQEDSVPEMDLLTPILRQEGESK